MEFIALFKTDKNQISKEGGNVLFLLLVFSSFSLFLLSCVSAGNVTHFPPLPTQKWRSTLWFSCITYSSLPELLFHYGIIKNLASLFQDTCQVSNCRHFGFWNRKFVNIKCSSQPRMIQKLCHQCSQFPSFANQTHKKFEVSSDKHRPQTFNEHGDHGIKIFASVLHRTNSILAQLSM